jgi:uncharacterized membrane protein
VLGYSTGVYDVLKLAHVLAAVCWVGGDFMLQLLGYRLQKENDSERLAWFGRSVADVGQKVITPLSVLLIVFAVALVAYSPQWNFSDLWIELAIAGYVVTLVTGAGYLGPRSGKLAAMVNDGRGVDEPEVRTQLNRLLAVARWDLLVLFLVVVDMVLKPGT